MSEPPRFAYDSHRIELGERQECIVTNCPDSIENLLRRANFSLVGLDKYSKKQRSADGDRKFTVATVTIHDNLIHIETRDVVGVISITQNLQLQINPKVGWEPIFDMLLAVSDKHRSTKFHGVPIGELIEDEVDIADILAILAINYLDGLRRVHRKGLIRDLITRRADLDSPRGTIDVERSLINQAMGNAAQHCLLKEVEYDNVPNSLLHFAGTALLRLFHQYGHEYESDAYDYVFSEVHNEVRKLERRGITSNRRRIRDYRSLDLYDLPRQRHYYGRAIEVSKAILESSVGELGGPDAQLLIDYVLNMEWLFEEYSAVTLEQELDRIRTYDYLNRTENVEVERSPTEYPFEADYQHYHQPDHSVTIGDETAAIIDSKYYSEENDPSTSRDTRAQLFSYAYLFDSDRMCFLTPLNDPQVKYVQQTGAELRIVSPENGFSIEGFETASHDYLLEVLGERYPVLEIFHAVSKERSRVSLDGVTEDDLHRLEDPSGPFVIDDVKEFSLRTVKAAADTHSYKVLNRSELEQEGTWTRERIESMCSGKGWGGTTTCVPVFNRDNGEEWIDLYFYNRGVSDPTEKVQKEGPLKLL